MELKLAYLLWVLALVTIGSCDDDRDWLVDNIQDQVSITEKDDLLIITNNLVTRTFTTKPAFGTIDYRSEIKDRSILRTLLPEAFVTLDGIQYPIGGLSTSPPHSFLNTSTITVLPNSFQYDSYKKSLPVALFHWEPGLRHSPSGVSWPPNGLTLSLQFKPPKDVKNPNHTNVVVTVNYEMYEGIPLLVKWITVANNGAQNVTVDKVIVENLGTQKPYAPISLSPMAQPWEHDTSALTASWLYVEANIPHGASVNWGTDLASGQSPGADEPTLACTYSVGPGITLANIEMTTKHAHFKPGDVSSPQNSKFTLNKHKEKMTFHRANSRPQDMLQQFDTFRVLELVTDSYDRERVALSRHRMTRLLAPQTQENPIFFHGTDSSSSGFKNSIDQMAAVGFEMYIYSFGSGFNLENLDKANLDAIKADIEYAASNGIEVGGYDLIDLERGHGGYGGNVGDQWDVVSPDTGKLTVDACFASGWYDKIKDIIFTFITETGLSMLETDGPYGGAACAAKNHTHHNSVNDSVYWQTRLQAQLYADLRALNVFINQPDNYFYWGGSKSGMGYNENQYSLPRWEDLSVSRQGMYDDTYHFLPTQGWMFVPLVQYHGGGAAAMFEPLSDHIAEYEWALAQYLGYGVAACYRGPRLYDSDATMAVVKKWVDFYKTYRDILISDIVHVRRPDMQDYDCILHVNPQITNRGLAMVFNPTDTAISHNISLPLYYTGISNKALVLQEGVTPGTNYTLDRDFSVTVPVKMDARSITWILIKSSD